MDLPEHDCGRALPSAVARAVHYMRKHRSEKIAVADLVAASGAAARTLRKQFRGFLGISPMDYLRRLRLAAVRETLLGGAGGESVTNLAARSGFTHFGRFAVEYRRCFGESPSTTLQRARAAARSRQTAAHETARAESGGNEFGGQMQGLLSRERPSIVVLPLRTTSAEPSDRWFTEALVDEMAATLGKARSLSIIVPRRTRTPAADPQQSARGVGARYFLVGSLSRASGRSRIIMRLAHTATGQQVWGDVFDGATDDMLHLRDRVIAGVAAAILPNIRRSEIAKAQRMRPCDLYAYGLAMRAIPFVFASRPDASRQALELLNRAMELDPDYGLASALAAWCHGQLVMYNGAGSPADERANATRLADRAAILDSDDPLALTACCAVHTMAGEFDTAHGLLARALARDPALAWAWGRSGWLHSYAGNYQTAIEHFRQAISLEPISPANANNFVGIGGAHFGAGRYQAAAAWTRKAMVEQPSTKWANRTLSVAYARMGEPAEAARSFDTLRRYCPDLTVGRVVDAVPFRQSHLDRLAEGLSDLGLPA